MTGFMTLQLSTDILENKFGKLILKVLFQEGLERKSCLFDKNKNVIACSTVLFYEKGISKIPALHEMILQGAPIGKTLNDPGIQKIRENGKFKIRSAPNIFQELFHTKEKCFSRRVEYAVNGIPYASIMEYYNPEFIKEEIE